MNSSDMKFNLLSLSFSIINQINEQKKKIASLVENWFTLSFLNIQESESSKH